MPEGDTITRTAAALRTALVGQTMVGFRAPRLSGVLPVGGTVIETVESTGKHLEITWADGVVLHTHMRMTGSWHLYRPGERWRKPAAQMRVVIETKPWVAVCFNAPVVETHRVGDAGGRSFAVALGPDLCRADADLAVCVERMVRYPDPAATVGEVLLDQRVACGVGNVYRAEVLFACRVNPFVPVGRLDATECEPLIATAARMLRANLVESGRIADPNAPGGLAVYGRAGRPCIVCGTAVASRRLGAQQRLVSWCPTCQPDRE